MTNKVFAVFEGCMPELTVMQARLLFLYIQQNSLDLNAMNIKKAYIALFR